VKPWRNHAGRQDIRAFPDFRRLPHPRGDHPIERFPFIRVRSNEAMPVKAACGRNTGALLRLIALAAQTQFQRAA
jgi:hypothetical protein